MTAQSSANISENTAADNVTDPVAELMAGNPFAGLAEMIGVNETIAPFRESLAQTPWLAATVGITVLLLLALAANFIVKHVVLRMIRRVAGFIRPGGQAESGVMRAVARLANVIPALVMIWGIVLVPYMPEAVIIVVRNVASAFIIVSMAMVLAAVLDILNALYMRRPDAHNKPIKGYIQVLKIVIAIVATILMIATLIDKSPLILLSGLGAMAAVLMLVFQDTLLSLVASVQISSSDMVRVGDWIEMPHLNADGDVIDIALHTVKVQNWDKTITTLPTKRLISDPFKNWRGMHESGGRRIKRAIHLDQGSIHFLTDAEKDHLKEFSLLADYLSGKDGELARWNEELGDKAKNSVNQRRLTNIGTFRAYVRMYLENHKGIHQNMTMLVRQLAPTAEGLPLEIYCFTSNTAWAVYENTQSDIFDHLYAILPQFGLRAFQNPGGHDMQSFAAAAAGK